MRVRVVDIRETRVNQKDYRDLGILGEDLADFRREVKERFDKQDEKLDETKKELAEFKETEAREGASHMTREECQKQETNQNIAIDDLKATINRYGGALTVVAAIPAFIGTLWAIIQIYKSIGS